MILRVIAEGNPWRPRTQCAPALGDAVQDFAARIRPSGSAGERLGGSARRFSRASREQGSGFRKAGQWNLFGLSSLAMAVLLGGLQSSAFAQQASGSVASNSGLPDAPGVGELPVGAGPVSSTEEDSARISGTVLDTNGAVIQGAQLRLANQAGTAERSLLSGSNGEFNFARLPPGIYKVTVTGPGMGTYVSPEIALLEGDQHLLSQVALPISAAITEVRVSADRNEIAEEQVHLALNQRVLGIVPNFYSTYDWNAPPMGSKQKFELAFRAVTDPVAFVENGAVAGIEQATNTFPGFGQGAEGYGKRYGAAYANHFIGTMMSSAVLPSLLHQDPRYFYKGSGSFRSRAFYAISAAVVCRGDNGRLQPNYSHILGGFAVGGISNLYYPSGSRGVSLILLNAFIGTAGHAGNNLLREFVLRGLTTKVPDYANGKP